MGWRKIDDDAKTGDDVLLCNEETDTCMVASWEVDPERPDFPWQTLDGAYHKDWPTLWMPIPERSA